MEPSWLVYVAYVISFILGWFSKTNSSVPFVLVAVCILTLSSDPGSDTVAGGIGAAYILGLFIKTIRKDK